MFGGQHVFGAQDRVYVRARPCQDGRHRRLGPRRGREHVRKCDAAGGEPSRCTASACASSRRSPSLSARSVSTQTRSTFGLVRYLPIVSIAPSANAPPANSAPSCSIRRRECMRPPRSGCSSLVMAWERSAMACGVVDRCEVSLRIVCGTCVPSCPGFRSATALQSSLSVPATGETALLSQVVRCRPLVQEDCGAARAFDRPVARSVAARLTPLYGLPV